MIDAVPSKWLVARLRLPFTVTRFDRRTEEVIMNRSAGLRWIVSSSTFCLLLSLTASSVAAYEAGSVADGGTVAGVVRFAGTPPAPRPLDVNKDKEVCAKEPKFAEDLVVGSDGGVRWAVAFLKGVAKGKPFPNDEAVLDQHGCRYVPHVVIVPAGRDLVIKNSDGILHNIHTYSDENPPLNRAQPKFKKKIKASFDKPEIIRVGCDVHGWMGAWLVVADHPYYAVTDEKGAFRLTDVPPGDYELVVWHEKLGETVQKVSVKPGQETTVDIELSLKE